VKVRDLMSRPALAVRPELPIRDVAAFLWRHRISGAPVIDGEGRLLGVISESDVVDRACRPNETARFRRGRSGLRGTTAGELMTTPAITAAPTTSDYNAAWLMSHNDVDRLPVVERGALVGVVSRADLTREFARSDARIAADIRSSVIDALAVPGVQVAIRDGNVLLTGTVDSECDRACLRRAVLRVPGVVTVRSLVSVRSPKSAAA